MAEIRYKRLTRARSRSTFAVAYRSRSSLWLGDDHLLCVNSTGYTEAYKRFYFRDIQSITICATKRRFDWNIILGMALAFTFVLTLIIKAEAPPAHWSGNHIAGRIFLGTIAAIFTLLLLINNFSGPTCKTFLRTAVQIEDLPSLCRIRQTRKVLEKIRPMIVAAQGEMSPDEISARMRETVQPAPSQSGNTPSKFPE